MQSTVLRNNYGINKVYLTKKLAFYNFFFLNLWKNGKFFHANMIPFRDKIMNSYIRISLKGKL